MDCRLFQLTLNSANDLENVREIFDMKVYAKVSIAGNSKTEKQTPTDERRGINPVWNHSVKYTIGETAVRCEGVTVVIKLYCERTLGDRYIGEVSTSIKQLFNQAHPLGGSCAEVCFPVKKGGKDSQGMLKFGYCFGERRVVEKTSGWKKFLKSGASILLQVALEFTTGIDLEIPIFTDDVNTFAEAPQDN